MPKHGPIGRPLPRLLLTPRAPKFTSTSRKKKQKPRYQEPVTVGFWAQLRSKTCRNAQGGALGWTFTSFPSNQKRQRNRLVQQTLPALVCSSCSPTVLHSRDVLADQRCLSITTGPAAAYSDSLCKHLTRSLARNPGPQHLRPLSLHQQNLVCLSFGSDYYTTFSSIKANR